MKVLNPTLGSPAWGSGFRRRSPQSICLRRPVGFDHRNSTGLGETETPVLESAHKVSCALGPRGKSSDLTRAWAKPICWYWRVSYWWGEGGRLWLTVGTKTLVAVVLGSTHWCKCSWRLPFSHQDLAPATSL